MKKRLFSIMFVLVLGASLLVACSNPAPEEAITIAFETNGGSTVQSITVDRDSGINLPETQKNGFTFGGWFEAKDLSGAALTSPYRPAKSVTIYAKWVVNGNPENPDEPEKPNAKSYTITFVSNGGSFVDPITQKEGSVLNLPKPSRESYDFINWCTNITMSSPFTQAQMPSSNITLYANWSKVELPFESKYMTAKGFTEYSDPSLRLLYPNFEGKALRRKLTSGDVGILNETEFDLNTNITPTGDYVINWFSDDRYSQLIGAQKGKLGYSNNVFFATINERGGRVQEVFLINLYVRNEYTYKYYDTPYAFAFKYDVKPKITQTVIEDDYPAAVKLDNTYTFSKWTDSLDIMVNLNGKAIKNAEIYANYQNITATVTAEGEESSEVTITPFADLKADTLPDKDDKIFNGYVCNDKPLIDEEGAMLLSAKDRTPEDFKKLTLGWVDYTQDKYFNFTEVIENRNVIGYKISLLKIPANNKLFLPLEYKGKPITSTATDGFKNSKVVQVKVPTSITISLGAFAGCNSLTRFSASTSNNLGYYFGAASASDNSKFIPVSLVTIIVPNSTTSIGNSAFYNCSSLTSITIPNSVTSIGGSAFYNCSSLTSITIPNSVTSIGGSAFRDCSSLTIYAEAASCPSGWNSNWNSSDRPVVWSCKTNDKDENGYAYTTIDYITYQLKGSAATVFGCSTNKSGQVTIPSSVSYKDNTYSVTSIGSETFRNCNSLTSITIPNSVTSIGNSAFSGCSSLTSITIPNSVTSIGNSAFRNCNSLTSITIPNSVTSIGSEAFSYCRSLTSITIGNSVTSIGEYAFRDCSSLTSITIPNSVTSIGYSAFSYCRSLTSITIGNSVTSIGADAFYDCSSLTSITIPNSVTSIGSSAFYGCSKLTSIKCEASSIPIGWNSSWKTGCTATVTWGHNNITTYSDYDYVVSNGKVYLTKYKGSGEDVVVPASIDGKPVVSIGAIFANNTIIASIIIPNSVTSIGNYAFYGCSGLTSITIGNSVTSIGSEAFRNCSSLTSITIPNSVTSIGNSAFRGCSSLTSITIPNSVTSIGDYAFRGCSSLTSITIPNSVTSIGSYAFDDCRSLTIYAEVESCPSGWSSNWNSSNRPVVWSCKTNDKDENGYAYTTIDYITYQLKGSTATVFGCSPNKTGQVTIPSSVSYKDIYSVTSIGDNAFRDCSSLTSITIPNSVTSIGRAAFEGCSSLTSITIPNSVTSIGDYAFNGCSSLTSITIPNSVTSIGNYAFYGCSSLTSITIPNSVTSIGNSAFYGCSSLTSITIPNSVTSIEWDVFYNCSSLTIYAEVAIRPNGWSSEWNSSNRPVVWGCVLSEDKIYVVSFVKSASSISAGRGIKAPYRAGYTFGGWATTAGGTVAAFAAADINSAPNGTTLYAIWTAVNL